MFLIILQLLKLAMESKVSIHAAELRTAIGSQKQFAEEYHFLKDKELHTQPEIVEYLLNTESRILELEKQRQAIRNANRRPKTAEERAENNAAAREITRQLKPLRKEAKLGERVLKHYPQVWSLVKREHELESQVPQRQRERSRGYER